MELVNIMIDNNNLLSNNFNCKFRVVRDSNVKILEEGYKANIRLNSVNFKQKPFFQEFRLLFSHQNSALILALLISTLAILKTTARNTSYQCGYAIEGTSNSKRGDEITRTLSGDSIMSNSLVKLQQIRDCNAHGRHLAPKRICLEWINSLVGMTLLKFSTSTKEN